MYERLGSRLLKWRLESNAYKTSAADFGPVLIRQVLDVLLE